MHIREATREDATAIDAELLVPAFREDEQLAPDFNELDEEGMEGTGSHYWLDEEDRTVFVAESDVGLLAHVSAVEVGTPPIYERGSRAHIDGLYVKDDYRRRGIATSLIERVEEWARSRGCETLGVSVHEANEGARALYERDFELTFLSYRKPVE